MTTKSGFFEELYRGQKSYPDQHRIHTLQPTRYAKLLTQHLANRIGERLEQMAEQQDFQNMIQLTAEIEQSLFNTSPQFELPLSAIHYWYGDQQLPSIQPGMLTQASLITNQGYEVNNFFKTLKYEMLTADRADLMVSFIRWSGVQLLVRSFEDLRAKGKKIRILTSTYMNITEPKALSKLLEMDHVEVKIYDTGKTSFHTKAYLFSRDSGFNTVIIGSSNLSHSALNTGYEWNVKLPHDRHIGIYERAHQLFDEMWHDANAIPLTSEWIEIYKQDYMAAEYAKRNRTISSSSTKHVKIETPAPSYQSRERITQLELRALFEPNSMQKQALLALEETRNNGHAKGVVIAATGTGKTYLSAFDVLQAGAKRVLFVAHRDELLENAKETFVHVMGESLPCGKLSGKVKEWDNPFLFSTVQTLHRELERFEPDQFDYIVIDEFHHADAATYRKVLDYFQPKFLLGLTATPERMDGRDVLALCDYNVVYEIRLHEALKNGLLAPFHYFGLSDTVDYEEIGLVGGQLDEGKLAKALSTHERVDYVIEMINKYGHDGERRMALGFCASIEHARFMAEQFSNRGLTSTYLTGSDDPLVRQNTISRLEDANDPLEFIFTVNIFNEGIDIPSLNLVLFLRPTESATIFLQQLGRGLRKADGKDYVTILDFIGNYQKSFIVPLALSGQTNHKAFDRDLLRVTVENDFTHMPEGCFVDLEEISREQILEKIAKVRMDANQMLSDLYQNFRRELGRAPELEDFLYSPLAPSAHYFIRKYGSWVETKKKMRDLNDFDELLMGSTLQLEIVQRLEQALPLKWPYEFVLLYECAKYGQTSVHQVVHQLQQLFGVEVSIEQHEEHIVRAMQRLAQPYKKQTWSFGEFVEGEQRFFFNPKIQDVWTGEIGKYLTARLLYGFTEFRFTYRPELFFKGEERVILYQNYTRNELIYLFKSNAQEGSWREGVSTVDNNILLFNTLRKSDDVAEQLNYHDYFVDNTQFHWQSQNSTSHTSSRGQQYIEHRKLGINIHLFVRKYESMYGETLPFMYVGKIEYVRSHGDKPMNILWKLEQPLPEELFLDLVR